MTDDTGKASDTGSTAGEAGAENGAIVLDKLSKRYGNTTQLAISKLSLTIKKGEVYGLLGPNGAGKSTTIRTLLNFIQPTSGRASIMGHDIVRGSLALRRSVGYLAGEVALYDRLRGDQFLRFMSDIQGHESTMRGELVKQFHVSLRKPIRSLSRGNRQKLGIVQAFMHEPDVLILDEPTTGLDPLMQEEFYKLVHKTKQRGATVLVSSHNLSEVQRMCDRVGFIRGGKLIREQRISELGAHQTQIFVVVFANAPQPKEFTHLDNVVAHQSGSNSLTIEVQGGLSPLLNFLSQFNVISLEKHQSNLEDEFLSLYKEQRDEK